MPEPNMICDQCERPWGEPRLPIDGGDDVCPDSCHDREKWAAIVRIIKSHGDVTHALIRQIETAQKLERDVIEQAEIEEDLRTRIAELEVNLAETKEGWRQGILQKEVNMFPETEAAVHIAELEQDREQVRLRLGCIARVSNQHDLHVCPADGCLVCWPTDIVDELAKYAAREGSGGEG